MWVFATKNGHKQALRGLLRRRYAEACLFMGYDWTEACDNDAIALQRQIPDTLPGTDRVIYKTPFKDVLSVAQRYSLPPLDEPELVLTTPIKADPVAVPAAGTAGQPVPLPGPAPAGPAIEKPASNGPASVAAGEGVKSLPPTTPAKLPPVAAPPLPKDAAPTSIEPKDLVLSKRFWGLFITGIGTTNFLPRAAQEWIGNEGNRELLTMLLVVIIGLVLFKIGQVTAKRPLK
jgi:hypothetical protein